MLEERLMIGRPVRDLQYMLWVLSQVNPKLPFVAMDGVFGEQTLEGVMTFQRELAPPVTGRVDQSTWDALVREFRQAEHFLSRPQQLRSFPDRPFQVLPGEQNETMALIQTLFQILGERVEGIVRDDADGYHGEQSVQNVKWLQHCASQAQTGVMDRDAWDMLSRLYGLFVVYREGVKELPAMG